MGLFFDFLFRSANGLSLSRDPPDVAFRQDEPNVPFGKMNPMTSGSPSSSSTRYCRLQVKATDSRPGRTNDATIIGRIDHATHAQLAVGLATAAIYAVGASWISG